MKKLVNNIKRGDLANCIILHDFSMKKPNFKKWLEYVDQFFNQHGIIPTRIGGHSRKATKTINFNNGVRKLEKNNYDTNHIWIGALPPEHNSDMFCAIFDALISIRKNNKQCGYLTFDNQIVDFDAIMIDQLALDLIKLTGARYGYGFQRNFLQLVGYEWGGISGLEYGDPERKYITKWVGAYHPEGDYKTGYFRDIYPVNILSKEHLDNIIDPGGFFSKKKDLSEWIADDKRRGELIRLSKDRWSWHVEPSNISYVRESLRHTGIILCI